MKNLFSLLTVLLMVTAFSQVKAQSFTTVPTKGKYRITYSTDRVLIQDTTKNPGIRSYSFKKAQLFAAADRYTGGTVTIYALPGKTVVFKAPASSFRVVGVVASDSLKVKSILETL